MLRREFLLGAAASVAASSPLAALAADGPPLSSKAAFVAWMTANRPAEETKYLERRWDRYEVVISFHDLWTAAEKRAFLMTPRQEFCLPENREDAYVGHYLDIGFGVTITPPGTMGRMTSALDIRPQRQGARDRHRLGLPVGPAHLSHAARPFDRDHSRARPTHPRRLRPADRRRLSRIFRHHDPKRGRLFRLGGGWAVRQDHRHLRHRPHSAAAPAAIEAKRHHGHSRRAPRRAAHPQGDQESGSRRRPTVARSDIFGGKIIPFVPLSGGHQSEG